MIKKLRQIKQNTVILLVTFMVLITAGIAQEYYNRQPTADEMRKVAGTTSFLQDGPRENVFVAFPYSNNTPVTLSSTNSLCYFSSMANTAVSYIVILPDSTNNTRQLFRLIAGDTATMVITQASGQSLFEVSNRLAVTTSISIPSNSCLAFSTGTNWCVVPAGR